MDGVWQETLSKTAVYSIEEKRKGKRFFWGRGVGFILVLGGGGTGLFVWLVCSGRELS